MQLKEQNSRAQKRDRVRDTGNRLVAAHGEGLAGWVPAGRGRTRTDGSHRGES